MQTPDIMQLINNPKNWKKTHLKIYKVYACRPAKGTKFKDLFDNTAYMTDDSKQFIISGVLGDVSPISINELAKTYAFEDGTPITPDTLRSRMLKSGEIDWMKLVVRADSIVTNWAFHIPLDVQNFPVRTHSGETVLANREGFPNGSGDFVVCSDIGGKPNLNDVWVVPGSIFPVTYDLHAFPNMFSPDKVKVNTVEPFQSFVKKTSTQKSTEKSPAIKMQSQKSAIKNFIIKTMDSYDETGLFYDIDFVPGDLKHIEFTITSDKDEDVAYNGESVGSKLKSIMAYITDNRDNSKTYRSITDVSKEFTLNEQGIREMFEWFKEASNKIGL